MRNACAIKQLNFFGEYTDFLLKTLSRVSETFVAKSVDFKNL